MVMSEKVSQDFFNCSGEVAGCPVYFDSAKSQLHIFIPAGSEPSDHVHIGIWRLPRGWNTPQLAAPSSCDAP